MSGARGDTTGRSSGTAEMACGRHLPAASAPTSVYRPPSRRCAMCDHAPNREAAMVTVRPGTPERNGRDGVWCDPCLVPLVKALNDGGLPTISSCCGHGKAPSGVILADDTWILRVDRATADRIYDFLADSHLPTASTPEEGTS